MHVAAVSYTHLLQNPTNDAVAAKIAALEGGDVYKRQGSVSVHVFGSGVNNDICSPFERAAVNRSRESIVNNQRDTVAVRDTNSLLRWCVNRRLSAKRPVRAPDGVRLPTHGWK